MSFEYETVIPSKVFSFESNFQIAFIFSVRDGSGTVLYFSYLSNHIPLKNNPIYPVIIILLKFEHFCIDKHGT